MTDLRVAVSGAEMNEPSAIGSTTSCPCSGDRPASDLQVQRQQEQDAEFAEGHHQDRQAAGREGGDLEQREVDQGRLAGVSAETFDQHENTQHDDTEGERDEPDAER